MFDLVASKNEFTFYGFRDIEKVGIYFEDQLICTVSLREYVKDNPDLYDEQDDVLVIKFPSQMSNFLIGHTVVRIVNESSSTKKDSSLQERTILEKEVFFDEQDIKTKFTDKFGTKLSWNIKHNLVATTLDSKESLREKILKSAKELSEKLAAKGYKIAICSGALLSAVRENGKLSPNDDDIDFLCYFDKSDKGKIDNELAKIGAGTKSKTQTKKPDTSKLEKLPNYNLPSSDEISAFELNLLQLRLQKTLEEMGYKIFKHSGAHLQLEFLDENNVVEYYIDIFTAFEKEGYWCQPIFMRTELSNKFKVEDIYPFKKITIEGYEFDAPNKPEVWLEGCYGETWRIPNPNFKMPDNFSTFFRFDSWFGYSNIGNLPYWTIHNTTDHTKTAALDPNASLLHLNAVKKAIKKDDVILDFGCGDGLFTNLLENVENIKDVNDIKLNQEKKNLHPVYAFDFVERAIYETKEQLQCKDSKAIKLNFLNRYDMLKQAIALAKSNKHFIANISFGLHIYNDIARNALITFCNRVLNPGDYLVVSYESELDLSILDGTAPNTWHFDDKMLKQEVLDLGFSIVEQEESKRMTELGMVRPFKCLILKKEKRD